jgi:hypothetical protein
MVCPINGIRLAHLRVSFLRVYSFEKVTSSWLTHNIPQKKTTDRDFMKLNKIATKNKITTCKAVSGLKKEIDVRI